MIIEWTGGDVRAFQRAAGLTNERLAARLNVSVRSVSYWRKQGGAVLPDLAQRVLTRALDSSPEQVRFLFGDLRKSPVLLAERGGDDVVAAAASEACADPVRLATEFDPESVAWLWEECLEVAHAANRPAFDTFTAARRVRCYALDLAGRTRRPAVLADLFVISGQATALMASTAFDLNRWEESAVFVKSAVSYAALAGHASLQAWTLGLAALLANWRGEPDTAAALSSGFAAGAGRHAESQVALYRFAIACVAGGRCFGEGSP